jgi:uncharacterized protein YebE (UPF0316 family)
LTIEITTLIVYFLVGVVQDFCFTMNARYIVEKKVFPAVVFSFLTVVMNLLVLYNILKDLDAERSVLAIIVYSCGIAVGTYVAMKLPAFKKK